MQKGTVKFFNTTKGFGFIAPEDGSSDVFVHITAIERSEFNTLTEGQVVLYEIAVNKGKRSAANLQAA